MSEVKLTVAARSDVGRVRTNNEDAFNITDLATGMSLETGRTAGAINVLDQGVLLALSDGMGGHQAGEVASALVLQSLRTAMQSAASESIESQIEAAVQRANAVVARAARTENKAGMGATLTAVFVGGADAYVAEVGDSRAYLLRSGKLRQITRDQSLVQMMVDKGLLSQEDARVSPHKNVILQAMGLGDDVRVAIARLRLRRGDRLLLCSDGLSNSLSDDELREILEVDDPTEACDRLIERGNERGGEDNITAVVARLDGHGLELPRDAESVTATFEILKDFIQVDENPRRGKAASGKASPVPQASPSPAASSGAPSPARPARRVPPKPISAHPPARSGTGVPRSLVLGAGAVALVVSVYALLRWLQ